MADVTIANAPSGEDTSIDGTEKVPLSGNRFATLATIKTYVTPPDATTSAKGIVELATDGETNANVVVQGNDSRLVIPATISLNDSATATDGRDHLLTGGASKTLTLPNPATNSVIAVSNRSGNAWTIGRTGSDSIEGVAANDTLADGKDVVYRYRAVNNWRRIGSLS